MKLNSAECSRINEILKNGNLTKLKKLSNYQIILIKFKYQQNIN